MDCAEALAQILLLHFLAVGLELITSPYASVSASVKQIKTLQYFPPSLTKSLELGLAPVSL